MWYREQEEGQCDYTCIRIFWYIFFNVCVDVCVTLLRQSLETAIVFYSLFMKTRKTFTFGKHCPLDFPLPLCFSPHVPISSNSAEVLGSNCLAVVFFCVCHTGALRADAVLACHLLTLLLIPGTLGSGWLSQARGFCGSRNNAGHYKPDSDNLELTLLL